MRRRCRCWRATWLLVIANLYFGVQTELTAGIATAAANALFGGLQ